MYKDKAKQRDAVKLATRRYRAKQKVSQGITVSQEEMVIPKQSHNPMMVGYEPPR